MIGHCQYNWNDIRRLIAESEERVLARIAEMETTIMGALEDASAALLAADDQLIADIGTEIQTVSTAFADLDAKIAGLQSGTPVDPATIQSLVDGAAKVKAAHDTLATAIAAAHTEDSGPAVTPPAPAPAAPPTTGS